MAQIEATDVPKSAWAFGGGTVLMLKFKHRLRKDVDIYLNDPQLLTRLPPRLNDALEAHVMDYAEQAHCVRLFFKEGEIDFISSFAPHLAKLSKRLGDLDAQKETRLEL